MKHLFIPLLAGMVFCSTSAQSQNLDVYGGDGIIIADGAVSASRLNGTDFGSVKVSATSKEQMVKLLNTDDFNPTTLQYPIISGPNAADFSVYLTNQLLNGGIHYAMYINFDPSAAGVRSATITINTNVPGDKAAYTFAVKGYGVNGLTFATPDLDMMNTFSNVSAKFNPNTNLTKLKWKQLHQNDSAVAIEGGLITFYYSPNFPLNFNNATILGTSLIKPMKPTVDGKKQKISKVNFKAEVPYEEGYVYAVGELPLGVNPENNQLNNLAYSYFTNSPLAD